MKSKTAKLKLVKEPESAELALKTQVLPEHEALVAIKGWDKLDHKAQTMLMTETTALKGAAEGFFRSGLSVGEHLTKVKEILEPRRMFSRYLRSYNFNRARAYTLVENYKLATSRYSETTVRIAAERNIKINSEAFTIVAKQYPEPKNADERQRAAWLVKTKELVARREANEIPRHNSGDPEHLLRVTYRYASLRFKKLPKNSKTRRAWVEGLIGMMLTDLGVGSALTFEPRAIPDDFRAVVGRPKRA